jgi:hypothetical protein
VVAAGAELIPGRGLVEAGEAGGLEAAARLGDGVERRRRIAEEGQEVVDHRTTVAGASRQS